ncbi:MAG: hypothetical protein LQ338_006624, partial [Usnochroma carphineum]
PLLMEDHETFLSSHVHIEEVEGRLDSNEQMEDPSESTMIRSDVPSNSNGTLIHGLPNVANLMDSLTSSRATLGALYGCITLATKLQKSVYRYGPALSKLLKDITLWIRANPYEFIGILGGSMLFVLACATPAILGAIGFSAIGPVAGSIAAGWQATMGSVAAGSLFAFLQSAAMGGPAMGLFVGIGASGGAIAVAAGLASLEGVREKVAEDSKRLIALLAENSKGAVGGLMKNFEGTVGCLKERFMGLFRKTKDD